MPALLLLQNGRVPGNSTPVDLLIGTKGVLERIAPRIAATAAQSVVDLKGRLVVPGLVDAHQHLDKTRLRTLPNPEGTLYGAIDAFRQYAAGMSEDDVASR